MINEHYEMIKDEIDIGFADRGLATGLVGRTVPRLCAPVLSNAMANFRCESYNLAAKWLSVRLSS